MSRFYRQHSFRENVQYYVPSADIEFQVRCLNKALQSLKNSPKTTSKYCLLRSTIHIHIHKTYIIQTYCTQFSSVSENNRLYTYSYMKKRVYIYILTICSLNTIRLYSLISQVTKFSDSPMYCPEFQAV